MVIPPWSLPWHSGIGTGTDKQARHQIVSRAEQILSGTTCPLP
jgi:hypothetical protein